MRYLLLAALAAALASGCDCGLAQGDYFGRVDPHPDPTTMHWCNSDEPEYVDPALVTSTAGVPLARLMFAGLAENGTDMYGTSVPAIATRWEVSEDQRTFTFYLRDDAVWSNGRPITAHDFVYGITRILHPKSISRNVELLEPIKNATPFNAGKVKMLLRDAPPFRAGDIVEVVGTGGKVLPPEKLVGLPNSNIRASSQPLKLRDLGAPESAAYATVPPGEEVDLVEIGGPKRDWAYVYWSGDDWRYGWVPLSQLDIQPNGEVPYTVRDIPPERRPGVTLPHDPDFQPRVGTVPGSKLLMLPEVLGIRAEGDHVFVVETAQPTPYLIDSISGRAFRPTPRESVSRSPKRWTRPEDGLLVTSGAFTMTEWHPKDKMVFVKSPTYFDADKVKLKRFISYNMADQAASANLYYQGGCDAVTSNNIPASYLPMLQGSRRGGKPYKDYITRPYLGIYYYVINTEKLTNVHLRRALNMSIDRSVIPKLTHGGELPTSSFTPGAAVAELTPEQKQKCGLPADASQGVAAFLNPDLCYSPPIGLEFNVEEAKKELAIAKKEMGVSKISFELKFNAGSEGHKIIAEYVQNQWKKNLGLDIPLQVEEWKTYLKDTTAGNFEVGRMGWIGSTADPESSFLIVLRCNEDGKPSPFNRAHWCNKKFNRLYEEAQRTLDRSERLAILRRAEKIALEQAPTIPLYVYTQRHLRKPYIRDMALNLSDSVPMQWAWIDPDWDEAGRKEAGR